MNTVKPQRPAPRPPGRCCPKAQTGGPASHRTLLPMENDPRPPEPPRRADGVPAPAPRGVRLSPVPPQVGPGPESTWPPSPAALPPPGVWPKHRWRPHAGAGGPGAAVETAGSGPDHRPLTWRKRHGRQARDVRSRRRPGGKREGAVSQKRLFLSLPNNTRCHWARPAGSGPMGTVSLEAAAQAVVPAQDGAVGREFCLWGGRRLPARRLPGSGRSAEERPWLGVPRLGAGSPAVGSGWCRPGCARGWEGSADTVKDPAGPRSSGTARRQQQRWGAALAAREAPQSYPGWEPSAALGAPARQKTGLPAR